MKDEIDLQKSEILKLKEEIIEMKNEHADQSLEIENGEKWYSVVNLSITTEGFKAKDKIGISLIFAFFLVARILEIEGVLEKILLKIYGSPELPNAQLDRRNSYREREQPEIVDSI